MWVKMKGTIVGSSQQPLWAMDPHGLSSFYYFNDKIVTYVDILYMYYFLRPVLHEIIETFRVECDMCMSVCFCVCEAPKSPKSGRIGGLWLKCM